MADGIQGNNRVIDTVHILDVLKFRQQKLACSEGYLYVYER
jgi:hypothetical protein